MDESTLSRLAEFEKDDKFYDALQFYRTKVTRSFRLKNASDAAIPLVKHSLDFFFKAVQYQCAIDMLTLYIECLSKNNSETSTAAFELIAKNVARLADFAEVERDSGNQQNENVLVAARGKCVDLTIQWTKQKENSKYGNAEFHRILANAFLEAGRVELAKTHFLLSDDVIGFSRFVCGDSSNEVAIVEIIAQILCLDRFPFAVDMFSACVNPKKYPFSQPLLNFQHLLFEAIEAENIDQFSELSDTYKTEIERSSLLAGFLTKIGQLYFGICDGLMGGQSDDKMAATSHLSAPRAANRRPAKMDNPLFSLGATAAATATAQKSSESNLKKLDVDDDLD
uniref:Uncharacterized protein n=1 Tax=Caenorhabditis japonica TaxID=281687 RepID=A0A8R1DV40_CAEJA